MTISHERRRFCLIELTVRVWAFYDVEKLSSFETTSNDDVKSMVMMMVVMSGNKQQCTTGQ
jgi:hypothetical protein